MTNTKIELPKEKQELFNELAASYGPDPVTVPIWTDGKTINEPLFAEEFLKTHKLAYCEGAFFGPDGRLDDQEPLRVEIFEILRPYVATNISKKVSNVIEVIKMSAYRPDLPLETDRIHPAIGTLFLNGEFREGKGGDRAKPPPGPLRSGSFLAAYVAPFPEQALLSGRPDGHPGVYRLLSDPGRKSFSSVMIANQEKYHVQYDNRIPNTAGRLVWMS